MQCNIAKYLSLVLWSERWVNALLSAFTLTQLINFEKCRFCCFDTNHVSVKHTVRYFRFTTLSYRAPEMIDLYSGMKISSPADVWVRDNLSCFFFCLVLLMSSKEDYRKIQLSVMLLHCTEIFSKRRKIYSWCSETRLLNQLHGQYLSYAPKHFLVFYFDPPKKVTVFE